MHMVMHRVRAVRFREWTVREGLSRRGLSGEGLVDIRSGQMLAWDSKIAEGLNTSDVPMEFCMLQAGVAEAFEAWRKGRIEIGQELADVAVHLFALARMTGIDMQDELEARFPGTLSGTGRRLR
jgi:hypothetical protein